MKQLFPRGKRIRPTDKDLVFYTALASLLPVFLLVPLTVRDWCSGAMARQESPCHGQHRNSTM